MSRIKLGPMDESEFSGYMKDNTIRYAAECARAGRWAEQDSFQMAEKSINDILPDGMRTKDHYFFKLRDLITGQEVGVAWMSIQDQAGFRSVFIYDIFICESCRGKGLGTETLKDIEGWAERSGAKSIWLHAFWNNQDAIALYRRLGYAETDVTMSKKII